jgi:signal peptidase I
VPTLMVGDLILVNKFQYGIRLPVIDKKIIANHDPQRGDVMVFRYPLDTRLDYIKRVVGVPGDEVAYLNQKLSINGKPVAEVPQGENYDDDSMSYSPMFTETLGGVEHKIRVDPNRTVIYRPKANFPYIDNCRYRVDGVVCKVPPGHYFMMGDNRDNSEDSRYWGFVPDKNIVGKAFFVWMNFGNLARIGPFH